MKVETLLKELHEFANDASQAGQNRVRAWELMLVHLSRAGEVSDEAEGALDELRRKRHGKKVS